MAVLIVQRNLPPLLGMLAALGLGALIGLFNGFMITRFRIPSFVVTLAGSLTLGRPAALRARRDRDDQPERQAHHRPDVHVPSAAGRLGRSRWLAIAPDARHSRCSGAPAARPQGCRSARCRGFSSASGCIAAAFISMIFVVNQDRGLPLVVVIVFALALAFAYLTERTRFGRHIFAVGRQRRGGSPSRHQDRPRAHHRLRARHRRSPPPAACSPHRG